MSTNKSVFDDLVEVLADSSDAESIQKFKLPESSHIRLDDLLQRNRDGLLSDRERIELQTFEHFEHVVRLLKIRVAGRKAS